jgi:hypothetical protein
MNKAHKCLIFFLISFITLIILSLYILISPSSEYPISEDYIHEIVTSDDGLMTNTMSINNILARFPTFLLHMIFNKDEQLHVRIDSDEFVANLHNHLVTGIYTGRATSPSKFFDSDKKTIVSIASSRHPVLLSIYYYLTNKISVTKASFCSSDFQCDENEVCTPIGCLRSFTIVVLPVGYDSDDEFMELARPKIEKLKGMLPLNDSTTRLRIIYAKASVCSDMVCNDLCDDCVDNVRKCVGLSSLTGFSDRFIGFVNLNNNEVCACSTPNAFISIINGGKEAECGDITSYVFGQQLGLCGLNISNIPKEGGSCPNTADIYDNDIDSDIMYSMINGIKFGDSAREYLVNNRLVDIH